MMLVLFVYCASRLMWMQMLQMQFALCFYFLISDDTELYQTPYVSRSTYHGVDQLHVFLHLFLPPIMGDPEQLVHFYV